MSSEHDDIQTYTSEDSSGMLDLVKSGEQVVRQQTEYMTAVSVTKPRDLAVVLKGVMEEIALDPEEMFYYWEVKTKNDGMKPVEGGSISLALAVVQNWTNVALLMKVEEDNTHYTFYPTLIDVEKGFTLTRAFKQIKKGYTGKMDKERAQDLQFQKGQSKAIRNLISNGTSRVLWKKCYRAARALYIKELEKGDISDKVDRCIIAFDQMGVHVDRLKSYVNIDDISRWTGTELANLRSAYAACAEDSKLIRDIFPIPNPDLATQKEPIKKETAMAEGDPTEQPTHEGTPDRGPVPDEASGDPRDNNLPSIDSKPQPENLWEKPTLPPLDTTAPLHGQGNAVDPQGDASSLNFFSNLDDGGGS